MSYNSIFESLDISILDIKKIELTRKLSDGSFESYILENYENGEFNFLPYDYIFIQLKNLNNKIKTVYLKGNIKSPGEYTLSSEYETLNSLIFRSGGYVNNSQLNDIVIKRDTSSFGSYDGNIILSPNDTVFVNDFNGGVLLEGEIHRKGILEWTSDRVAKDYIDLSGGLTSYADEKHIVYITPYGEAYRIKRNSRKRFCLEVK